MEKGDLVGLPIFTFLDRRLRPDDNIDSGGGRGEVGDMKLFCRRFAANPSRKKILRKCENVEEEKKQDSECCCRR